MSDKKQFIIYITIVCGIALGYDFFVKNLLLASLLAFIPALLLLIEIIEKVED